MENKNEIITDDKEEIITNESQFSAEALDELTEGKGEDEDAELHE